jgi:hypothetical protein
MTSPGSASRLVFDRPAHPAGADDDHVILRGVVYMHLLHLPDRVGHEVNLDVVEPDAFVLSCGSDEAAVVGLAADLDHRSLPSAAASAPFEGT